MNIDRISEPVTSWSDLRVRFIGFQVTFDASSEQQIVPARGLFRDRGDAETFARSWLATYTGDLMAEIAACAEHLGCFSFLVLRVLAKDARGEIVERWPAGRLG